MSFYREELQEALSRYVTDTLTYVSTVTEFCSNFPQWKKCREEELDRMKDIREAHDKLYLTFSHVAQSETKGKALKEFLRNRFQMKADRRTAELENELTVVLKGVMDGLEELHTFLDAVEELAVTSPHVFIKHRMLHLPENISFSGVQAVVTAAQQIRPLLLVFKRDASAFFRPKLQNVQVLEYMLNKYTETTKKICDKLHKR